MFALQREGINVVDGQELMSDAREIKTQDEITLLNMSAMMVDAAYYDLYKAMKPGMRENEAVGLVAKRLYDLGSEYVEARQRDFRRTLQPASARLFRSRAPARRSRSTTTSCTRTWATAPATTGRSAVGSASRAMVDAYKRCRDYLDASIELIRPGRTTAEVASVWPRAQEFGFPNEEAAFALQMGHGIGLAIWERPMISRLVSLEHPHEIKPGMVFALETFWPSTDGWSAARIEEEIVVTPTGHEVITRFPAEELLVAGAPFVTVGGTLPTMRETEAPPNPQVVEMIAAGGARRGRRRRKSAPDADGRQRGDACARDGAGNRQARVVAEEGRRARSARARCSSRWRPTRRWSKSRRQATAFSPASPRNVGDVIPVGHTIAWLVQPGETPPAATCRSRIRRRTTPSPAAAASAPPAGPAPAAVVAHLSEGAPPCEGAWRRYQPA